MGQKPEEVLKDAVLMLDVKASEKDENGNVCIKATKIKEIAQALRDAGFSY